MAERTYLDLAGSANLLGLPLRQLRRKVRNGEFPDPAGEDGQPFWTASDVLQWAARQDRELAARIPLRYWPTADEPARFRGAREVGQDIVLRWDAEPGTVAIVWRPVDAPHMSLHDLVRQVPDATVLVRIGADLDIDGPGVQGVNAAGAVDVNHDADAEDVRIYHVRWRDLARVLRQPMPYWPLQLRLPELISAWRPGAEQVVVPARPDLDTTALLRMAAMFEPGNATNRTLLALANTAQRRATRGAQSDLDLMQEAVDRFADKVEVPTTAVAAVPLVIGSLDDGDVDELPVPTRRIGWLELLQRTDTLSWQCVRQALLWNNGADFPFSHIAEIDPASAVGRELVSRLEPAQEHTAAFAKLDFRRTAELFIDPVTGAPVARERDSRVEIVVPQRLPATSPLAEIILDRPICVRTTDDTLYPAPMHHYYGLNWGYGGSGPGSLALLIYRLLDDINAEPADAASGAPRGLDMLTELKWPKGTVLNRALLEAARDGRPYDQPNKPQPNQD